LDDQEDRTAWDDNSIHSGDDAAKEEAESSGRASGSGEGTSTPPKADMDTGSVEKRLLASPYVKFKKGRPDLRKIMREEMDQTRMDGKMSVNGTSLFLQGPWHGLLNDYV
jgi:hypothetical protein